VLVILERGRNPTGYPANVVHFHPRIHQEGQTPSHFYFYFLFFLTMFIPGQYLSTRPVTVETVFVIV